MSTNNPLATPLKTSDKKHLEYLLKNYLADMFVTPERFVVLDAPKVQHKVCFVQACTHDGEIEVELGIKENGTKSTWNIY